MICRWCSKAIAPGDTANDPAGEGKLHVKCASTCRDRLHRWAEVEDTAIGMAVILLGEVLDVVRADGQATITLASPAHRQLTEIVARAKGQRP